MILLFVFSKVAIFKAVSVFLTMLLFQKMFSFGGVLLQQFMNMKVEKPAPVYGGPPTQSYDTVGYSYDPPGHEELHEGYPAREGGSFDWLLNKNIT
ncbi:unnamed protein product [Danaus chrysippus]|uniref:(African queen) hypothetical protein n=1 Tax=Danaus chrysippus TaxID=151541 RepID=A0A8J2R381_9NEOP|nr:unnamed protein product [Danaus chrysippus]